jgi:hypothetical protein
LSDTLSCDAIVDHGLIERYLAGLLSEAEVEALESHYLTCARCQTELRLAAAIREVLPAVQDASVGTAEVPQVVAGRRFGRLARTGTIAAAMAAVLAGILLLRPSTMESPSHRRAAPETEIAPTVQVPLGEVGVVQEFRWTSVTSADLYEVTLYDATGDVIWRVDTRETRVPLPDSVPLAPGGLYLWEVNARVGWDRWVSSELVRFRISEP